jgi:hypothetical protein
MSISDRLKNEFQRELKQPWRRSLQDLSKLARSFSGSIKFGWLSELNASARNCTRADSVTKNS